MPVLVVLGIPDEIEKERLSHFSDDLRSAVENFIAFDLNRNDVSVFFPKDHLSEGLGEEIIIFVEMLFEKRERTKNRIYEYAVALGEIGVKYFPDAVIAVNINSINPNNGFWSKASL